MKINGARVAPNAANCKHTVHMHLHVAFFRSWRVFVEGHVCQNESTLTSFLRQPSWRSPFQNLLLPRLYVCSLKPTLATCNSFLNCPSTWVLWKRA
eukprot:3245666-Amphidinium_carterae.1